MKLRRTLILFTALCLFGWDAGAAGSAEKIRIGIIGFESASSRISAGNADAIGDIWTGCTQGHQLYTYTIVFKDSNTVSVKVHEREGDLSAVFKLKK
ncbi:MAG: hypothetical protein LBS75_06945 [Synergistaceae bacterium]|nr:hypothetical protein [Synergistaceae bacterium]